MAGYECYTPNMPDDTIYGSMEKDRNKLSGVLSVVCIGSTGGRAGPTAGVDRTATVLPTTQAKSPLFFSQLLTPLIIEKENQKRRKGARQRKRDREKEREREKEKKRESMS